LEDICAKTKEAWNFYQPVNLEAEIAATLDAQLSARAQCQLYQVSVQRAKDAIAKLQVKGHGACKIGDLSCYEIQYLVTV